MALYLLSQATQDGLNSYNIEHLGQQKPPVTGRTTTTRAEIQFKEPYVTNFALFSVAPIGRKTSENEEEMHLVHTSLDPKDLTKLQTEVTILKNSSH